MDCCRSGSSSSGVSSFLANAAHSSAICSVKQAMPYWTVSVLSKLHNADRCCSE